MLIKKILPYLATVLVTVLAIYLTPLKWINIIEPTIKDVDPATFYNNYKNNKDNYLFIDVRSESSYKRVHAEGSINIPLYKMYDARHSLPKSGKEIVLICSGGRASGVAYGYLQHYGFFNIQRVTGGIENWIAQGLPVVSEGSTINPNDIYDGDPVSSLVIPCVA
jgi:phage shock protein E